MQSEAAEAARRQARKEAELRNGPAPDFDAEEDAETRKARAWDDWKVRLVCELSAIVAFHSPLPRHYHARA
jgi:hypothetical protein